MKNFLKYTLASCLGVTLAMIIFSVIGFISIAGFVSFFSSDSQSPDLPESGVLELRLGDVVPDRSNNVPFDFSNFEMKDVLGLQDMIRVLQHAKEDDQIKGLYINIQANSLANASALELHEAIRDFKSTGKFVFAYSDYYSQKNYFLASAADSIWLHPYGTVDFRGFGVMIPFVKDLLEKIGVEARVFYAGDFKSATEPLRLNEMSEENRTQVRAYLRDLYDEFLNGISETRDQSPRRLEQLADDFAIQFSDDAVSAGLVDVVGHEDEFIKMVRERINGEPEEKVNLIGFNQYFNNKKDKIFPKPTRDEIAVIYMEGDIIMKGNEPGMISSERYVKVLRQIREREKLKALVVRINSGGGNALASEKIARELQLFKEDSIPVVCSMADFAASGGYYIAAPSHYIYAEPSTLTGSIGVFSILPNASELFGEKLGITFDTVVTGPYATAINAVDELPEKAENYFQNSVDTMYQRFLRHVAQGRSMTVEEVHEIAQGRVWSGKKALEIGLVDSLGNMFAAIEKASDLANVTEYRVREYPRIKNPIEQLMEQFGSGDFSQPKLTEQFQKYIQSQHPAYQLKKHMQYLDGPQMRMPFYYQPIHSSHMQ